MISRLLCAVALVAVASPAAAVTVVSNTPGAPDPGVPSGLTVVADFSTPLNPLVVTNTTTGSVVNVSGTLPGQYAQPAPVSPLNAYQATQGNGTSTFSFTKSLGQFSLYWGSIDTYNKLEFLRGDGSLVQTFTGFNFLPAGGNQTSSATNRRVTFAFTGAEAVKKVRFSNSPQTNAFEYDTLAIAGIPEPTTWAMMILGFGLIGGAMRSRKSVTTKVAYA